MGEQHHIDFTGFVDEDGVRLPIIIKISTPRWVEETGDWHCELFAPLLFEETKKIFGISQSQAQILAAEFVKKLLGKRSLYNQGGQKITL